MATTFLTDENKQDQTEWPYCTKMSQFIKHLNWNKQFCVTNRLNDIITDNGETVMYTNMINVLEESDNRIVCHINDSTWKWLFENIGQNMWHWCYCYTTWIHGAVSECYDRIADRQLHSC